MAEIVLGMAHRGRLNVLANVHGEAGVEIFAEFLDKRGESRSGGGDVKYHLGYSTDRVFGSDGDAKPCTCRWRSTPATWSGSTPWCWGACAPSRTAPATPGARAACRC